MFDPYRLYIHIVYENIIYMRMLGEHTWLVQYAIRTLGMQNVHSWNNKCYLGKLESNVVMEYMDIGNLVLAVEKMNFTTLNLLKILSDVASGMEYLHGKKYIHRDLACNIVFLNSKKKCKIGNFGFCVYVGDTKGVYPEKVPNPLGYNISPETLVSKKFTMETDVWAMGVLCWELFYLVEHANEIPCGELKLRVHLEKFQEISERFIKPKPCPRNLYAYITGRLLKMNPKARPIFTEIKGKLKEFISGS